jgi:hypothetical protein
MDITEEEWENGRGDLWWGWMDGEMEGGREG